MWSGNEVVGIFDDCAVVVEGVWASGSASDVQIVFWKHTLDIGLIGKILTIMNNASGYIISRLLVMACCFSSAS